MLRLYVPGPTDPAARWFQLVWEWKGYRSPAAAERILPHGQVEVSWNLAAPHRFLVDGRAVDVPQAALLGARSNAYVVDTGAPAHLFGVVFRPGAAGAFLGLSMAELGPWIGPLSHFSVGRELEARVGEGRTARARLGAIQAFFSERVVPPRAREAEGLLAVWASQDGRRRSVSSLRQTLGLSAPTFVDRVRRQLGLRPAQLRQVLMFRDAVTALALHRGPVVEVAHSVGYCDQAHLNRAFQRHAGLTPGQFRPHLAEHPFNVPEPKAGFSFDPIVGPTVTPQ